MPRAAKVNPCYAAGVTTVWFPPRSRMAAH